MCKHSSSRALSSFAAMVNCCLLFGDIIEPLLFLFPEPRLVWRQFPSTRLSSPVSYCPALPSRMIHSVFGAIFCGCLLRCLPLPQCSLSSSLRTPTLSAFNSDPAFLPLSGPSPLGSYIYVWCLGTYRH